MTEARDPPRIAFRCDASDQIGGGHAMRCLTLANALSDEGATVMFVAAEMPDVLAGRIDDAGHQLLRIAASPELQRREGKWEEPPLSEDAQLADATATGEVVGQADWIIVDHYLLDVTWHTAARKYAKHILVIDDLANRSYDCDILLDQTLGRALDDYRELTPRSAKILAGPTYALLRPEFARERPESLKRRQSGGPVRRILISMGTTDPGGITGPIVEQVLETVPDCAIDVVLGPQARSLRQVEDLAARHSRVSIHLNSDRMAELMRDADVAVGAAGSTSWERCCLGLPSIGIALADNQRFAAGNLEYAGVIALAGGPEEIPALLQTILTDERRRLAMVAAGAAVTDGLGAKRVVQSMFGPPVGSQPLTIRSAQLQDCQAVWQWRNDCVTRRFSQTTAVIVWPDHEAWWKSTLESPDRILLIVEAGGAPVAALRFDRIGEQEFEVSINLAPSVRGSGLGERILTKGCETLKRANSIFANIHRDNPASRRAFEKAGFVSAELLPDSQFERYVLAGGIGQ